MSKPTKLTKTERIQELSAKAETVEARLTARILKVAKTAGLFDRKWTIAELQVALSTMMENQEKTRMSQLSQIKSKLKVTERQEAERKRREHARRMILLGSFLMAQWRHKPDLFASMLPELEPFLDTHTDEGVAKSNKDLLSDILSGTLGEEA
jgi:hypothetical protein